MPEWWEIHGMASSARSILQPLHQPTLFRLKVNYEAAGARSIHGLDDFLASVYAGNEPIIPLTPNKISSLGKRLYIQLPGSWILALHFALHGHLAVMSAEEVEFTTLCMTRHLPPTCPMLLHSVNPHIKSLAIVDRNKLIRMEFLDINPLQSLRPRDWVLPGAWSGACPATEQAQFEQTVMGIGHQGELARHSTPVPQYITQSYVLLSASKSESC